MLRPDSNEEHKRTTGSTRDGRRRSWGPHSTAASSGALFALALVVAALGAGMVRVAFLPNHKLGPVANVVFCLGFALLFFAIAGLLIRSRPSVWRAYHPSRNPKLSTSREWTRLLVAYLRRRHAHLVLALVVMAVFTAAGLTAILIGVPPIGDLHVVWRGLSAGTAVWMFYGLFVHDRARRRFIQLFRELADRDALDSNWLTAVRQLDQFSDPIADALVDKIVESGTADRDMPRDSEAI